jgi:hypothetical protein
MTPLQFYFPFFSEPVGEGAIEPPLDEVTAVARRMGCNEETARAVALHRRAIKALREAEETGYLQHVRDLSEKVEASDLKAKALPANFAERLSRLREHLATRGRGRPQRSIYVAHEVSELFSFLRQTQSYAMTLEWLKRRKRHYTSQKNVERMLTNYKRHNLTERSGERAGAITSVWDRDFERFFAWAAKLTEPKK